MRITIDEELCVGSGQCVTSAASIFTQRDDGIAEVLHAEPPAEAEEGVREAARLCPSRAILLDD